MKKVLFGITGLTLGGAERVLVDISNALCHDYDITIFTLYAKGELETQLDENVKIKSLYKKSYAELSKLSKIISSLRLLILKKYIYKKYVKDDFDIEVAFLEGPITRLFSVKNSKTKKMVWIHNDISKVFGNGIKSVLKKLVDKNIYAKYNELIFVSKDNLNKFEDTYKKLKYINKKVIYNYIDAKKVILKSNEDVKTEFDKNMINFVEVARLVPQKAIDRIIKVHNRLVKEGFNNHRFYIIGDGPEKGKLTKMIKENKLENSFVLLGKKENPYPYMKEADYFCLLSEFEGYGMVLEEAKILNKAIIITDTAAREAVDNYKNKEIIGNSEKAIYEKIKEILKERKIVNKIENYDNKENLENLIELFEEVINNENCKK